MPFNWLGQLSILGVTSWLETLCLHTVLLLTNRQSPALPVLNHNQRDAHGVYLRGYAHIPVRSWTETDREGSTALSVFSYYRDAQSFYSIGPIMAIHPLLLKSICFYLMPKQFPDALFFTPNTHHSIPLSLSRLNGSLPFSSTSHWTCKLLPTTGCGVIRPQEILLFFLFFQSFSFILSLPGTKGKHSIVIDLEMSNFYWRSHLITKADL